MEAVRWTNLSNVSASGNSIQKVAGCGGCADAGAISEQRISSSGGVTITAADASSLRFVGLSFGGGGQQPAAMQFALRLQGGVAEVRESGAYRSDIRFNAGDTLRVGVDGGAVKYSKNGSVFYTSSYAPQFPMFVDASIYDMNGSISNALIDAGGTAVAAPPSSPTTPAPTPSGSTSAPVRWANLVNAEASGSSLRKSSGCGGCPDAGAVSEQRISGNGSVSFTAGDTQRLRFVGLGWISNGTSATEIAYAIRLQNGVAEVREGGAYKRETSFGSGDTFEIRVENGAVSYVKNGAVFHTSGTAPQYPLFVDASLYDIGATISDAVITGGS